jgi:hypothetical protein
MGYKLEGDQVKRLLWQSRLFPLAMQPLVNFALGISELGYRQHIRGEIHPHRADWVGVSLAIVTMKRQG